MDALEETLALAADNPVVAAELAYDLDFNDSAKAAVAAALGAIPEAGAFLGLLVQLFWPASGKDVWDEIKDRVEQLINERIAQEVWRQTANALAGLQNVSDNYLDIVSKHPDEKPVISARWTAAQSHFLHDLPYFQSKDYQLLLLPLFAQFANLHLALQRDGAKFGSDWGWSKGVVDDLKSELTELIGKYQKYAGDVYEAGLAATRSKAPSNPKKTEPFNTVTRFQREMTLTVRDFALTWPYFDLVKYPDPVKDIPVTREIYSSLLGTSDDSPLNVPNPPTKPIRKITVWGWDRIDAAQVEWPAGGGPDGSSNTGRMGNRSGGSSQPPWGGTFDLGQRGQVVRVKARTGDALGALWLTFQDGSTSNQLGGKYPGGSDSEWSFSGELLSSIKIMGESRFYHSANGAVLGFKYKDERFPPPSPHVLRLFFVGDPAAPSPKQLAAKLGLDAQQTEELEGWAQTYEWDTIRRIAVAARQRRLEALKKST